MVLVAGKVHSGSQRWLSFGGISFQPSEFAKIAIVLALAKFFNEHGQYNEYRLRDLWQPFLLIAFPSVLIIKEPDLGTGLTLAVVSFSIILFVKVKWKSLLILSLTAISAVQGLLQYRPQATYALHDISPRRKREVEPQGVFPSTFYVEILPRNESYSPFDGSRI